MAGPPLLAAGITFSPLLEVAAAVVVVLAVSGLGLLTLVRVVPRVPRAAGLLLVSSSVSAFGGMALAWPTPWASSPGIRWCPSARWRASTARSTLWASSWPAWSAGTSPRNLRRPSL